MEVVGSCWMAILHKFLRLFFVCVDSIENFYILSLCSPNAWIRLRIISLFSHYLESVCGSTLRNISVILLKYIMYEPCFLLLLVFDLRMIFKAHYPLSTRL